MLELLRSLSPAEWQAPTIAKLWTVKDVVAHLLDSNIRTLSMSRDHYFGEKAAHITSQQDLIHFLNRLNADWVQAMKRVSPQVLIDLLAETGPPFCKYLATLDPFKQAIFAVDWAGEQQSQNWFHIAREYTEKWHHQQQVRDAVNKPGILTKKLYYPCLDTFMMALPYTYRNVAATTGTLLQFTISGEGGGDWYLVKHEKWELTKTITGSPVAHTIIDGKIAWKLFSKSWRRKEVMDYVTINGDKHLGEIILDMIAVMA